MAPTNGGGHSHRPSLKQSNKAFKSKHSSKGSLRDAAKGRIEGNSGKKGGKTGASITAAQNKANRRNTAKQIQAAKRAAVVEKNRLTKGGEARAPRVVAIVQLCADIQSENTVNELVQGAADIVGETALLGGIRQVACVEAGTAAIGLIG